MDDQQFRTSAFGGFHKQDVLSYIERASKEHAAQTDGLRQELDACRKARAEWEERAAAAEAREKALSVQVERLTADLAARTGELESARAGLDANATALSAAEEELQTLRARLEKAAPAAAAYESLKERTAGIELEAHQRAQLVEAEALEKVKKAKAGLEVWLGRVQSGYDRLRTDVDATISHASGELERVRRSLEEVSGEFSEHDAALEALLQTFHEAEGPKAPSPLPLD